MGLGQSKRTPLHLAALRGNKDVAELLLKTPSVHVDARDANSMTPLHKAAGTGSLAVAEVLIGKLADVNARFPVRNMVSMLVSCLVFWHLADIGGVGIQCVIVGWENAAFFSQSRSTVSGLCLGHVSVPVRWCEMPAGALQLLGALGQCRWWAAPLP